MSRARSCRREGARAHLDTSGGDGVGTAGATLAELAKENKRLTAEVANVHWLMDENRRLKSQLQIATQESRRSACVHEPS